MLFKCFLSLQVFHQGDIGTHWYVVISGTLDVCLINADSPDEVSLLLHVYFSS